MKITLHGLSNSLGGGVCFFCVQPKSFYKNFKYRVSVIFAGRAAYAFAFSALIMTMPQLTAAPRELVNVKSVDDHIEIDMAYVGRSNFLGRRVANYRSNKCYLLPGAAYALSRANSRLEKRQMRLVARDCWRPRSASDDMANWAYETNGEKLTRDDLSDTQNAIFEDGRLFDENGVLKTSRLFNFNYLAKFSNHNKGSTVDVELLKWAEGGWYKADTGTNFDVFSRRSAMSATVNAEARTNRNAIASAMSAEGFRGMATEWWHWTHRSSNGGAYLDGTVD